MMTVEIDAASPIPVYEQLRAQLVAMIVAGTLPAGTPLPPIRQLANDLGIAPGTVVHTYDTLEREGLIHRRHGRGTFVKEARDSPASQGAEQQRLLHTLAQTFARGAQQLGVSSEAALQAVQEALAEFS
jgi:DNA-binding transcriptional regulator YhcF (GntR family)